MTNSAVISQSLEVADEIMNVVRAGRRWFVELAPASRSAYARGNGGRREVPPAVGQAIVTGAQCAGAVAYYHRWGRLTTWHLTPGAGR